MKYSIGFRNGVLKKVLPPENRPVKEIAHESGLSEQTIRNWMKYLKAGTLELVSDETAPGHRSASEKLRLLLESKKVSVESMGQWLREQGLHSEHLPLWEQEMLLVVSDKSDKRKEQNTELLKENKKLKKELARKEKALAEIAALLVLKKKAEEIWGDKEGD
jgi:transposase-like protein